MIAYNKTKFSDLILLEQAKKWKRVNLIDQEIFRAIVEAKWNAYKRSNIFLRAGVFILTYILASSSIGLVFLFFHLDHEQVIGFFLLLFGAISIAALEYFIRSKNVFNTGIDESLLYFSIGLILGGITAMFKLYDLHNFSLVLCLMSCPLLVLAVIRYVDKLLAVCAWLVFLGILFFGIPDWFGMTVAKITLPFLTILMSLAAYNFIVGLRNKFALRFYEGCFNWLIYTTLITFYAGGNYFVVRELSTSFFDVEIKPGDDIPMAWFFYAFTILVPVGMVLSGMLKRNKPFLICGMLLCAAAVATIRYYYSIMPIEVALILGGTVMIVLAVAAYFLYKKKNAGITFEEDHTSNPLISKDLEAIFISQVMRQHILTPEIKYGGGEFGGGGAGGNTD